MGHCMMDEKAQECTRSTHIRVGVAFPESSLSPDADVRGVSPDYEQCRADWCCWFFKFGELHSLRSLLDFVSNLVRVGIVCFLSLILAPCLGACRRLVVCG